MTERSQKRCLLNPSASATIETYVDSTTRVQVVFEVGVNHLEQHTVHDINFLPSKEEVKSQAAFPKDIIQNTSKN